MSGDAMSSVSSTIMLKVFLAYCFFTLYAMTQEYADTVIKADAVLCGLSGLQCILTPQNAKRAWKYIDSTDEEVNERMRRNAIEIGVFLLSYSIYSGSLVFYDTVSKTQALGYATVPWLLLFVKEILDGSCKKYNVNEVKLIPWILYFAVIIVSTVL